MAERGTSDRRPRLTPAMADTRRAVREWAHEAEDLAGGTVLVALSGGGDSLALAWAAAAELPRAGIRVGAVVVNHQLQPGSATVAQRAADQAETWGLAPVLVKVVDVARGGGPEDAARTARYRALNEALLETGAQGILLAHTEDDQAETVLLGLARGSGPGSLKGMAPRDGLYHRPFLGLSRSVVRQALGDAGESWWDDPHNSDSRYARVRVRNNILPVLEKELGPGVTSSLARTADLFRQDSAVLEGMAQEIFSSCAQNHGGGHWSLPVAELETQPEALRSRLVRLLAQSAGAAGVGFSQIRDMTALVTQWRGQSEVSLSGARVGREEGSLHARIVS